MADCASPVEGESSKEQNNDKEMKRRRGGEVPGDLTRGEYPSSTQNNTSMTRIGSGYGGFFTSHL